MPYHKKMLRRWRPFGLLLLMTPWVIAAREPQQSHPFEDGITIWRKPDRLGRSCSSCHSPDGLEIAAYAFSDADITRRATPHVSDSDAKLIVAMIHQVRKRYHLGPLLDPASDRPMQPGSDLLAGATPMDRDASFAKTLRQALPLFFDIPISNFAMAKRARDQILAVDLQLLKIGIPINRLSEDGFHGIEHATITNWLPDVAMAAEIPVPLQDAYLANPSDLNYRALDNALQSIAPREVTLAQTLSLQKRRALFYFQHLIRKRVTLGANDVPLAPPNPMWTIAEFGRNAATVPIKLLGLPEDISAKKVGGPSAAEQMKELRLGWYWLGWTFDPGLQKTSTLAGTMRADYFTQFLWSDGPYPMHNAFMITRKLASEAFSRESKLPNVIQHLDLNYSFFTDDGGVAGTRPTNARHKQLFDAFAANSFRMNLYLQIDELHRTKLVYLRQALLQQLQRIRAFFTQAKDKELVDQLVSLIGKCKDAPKAASYPVN